MIPDVDIPDLIGMIGVFVVVMPFFLLQLGKISSDSMWYQMGNAFGSILIIISLIYHWNFSSFVIEILWLIISSIGIIRIFFKKKNNL